MWVPPEGRAAKIRVLPPWNAKGLFFKEIKFHWNIGPDNKAFPCRLQYSQDCFLCKALPAVAQKDPQLARQMQARPRYYMNILDMDNPDAGVQVYSCGKKALTDILSYIADPSWGDVTHPQTGRNVIVERSGTGRNSSFTIRMEGTASSVPESVLENLIDLDNMIMMPSNDEMMQAFESVASELRGIGAGTVRSDPPAGVSRPAPAPAAAIPAAVPETPPTSFTPPADIAPQDEAAMEAKIKDLLG